MAPVVYRPEILSIVTTKSQFWFGVTVAQTQTTDSAYLRLPTSRNMP